METNSEFNQPRFKLPTERGLLKMIFLGLITFGIYPIVIYSKISSEINTVASRYDGRSTMHYCLIYFIFSWLTLGIAPMVWFHRLCDRTGDELRRRGIEYKFGASDYWLWCILGSLICIGPYIFIYKHMQAMNLLNEDYNQNG